MRLTVGPSRRGWAGGGMSLPPVYQATINTPGYLPMDDDPPVFDTPQEAWAYLATERRQAEDYAPDPQDTGEYSDTVTYLEYTSGDEHAPGDPCEDWPTDADRCGVIYGGTPGYDGDHDLGVAYSVTRIDHANYPHEAGYLHDCRACEIRCHCTPGSAQCVYGGDHD